VFEHYTRHGGDLTSFSKLWQCMQAFTVTPAVVSQPQLRQILRSTIASDRDAVGVSTAEEFCEIVVRCAAVYGHSTAPVEVASSLAKLVERMEASAGTQTLRSTKGAFAADSFAFQRAGEPGRATSPRSLSPRRGDMIGQGRQTDTSHLREEISQAVRNVSPKHTVHVYGAVGSSHYLQGETQIPLPLKPLLNVMASLDHRQYLQQLFSHYSALSVGRNGMGQESFEMFLKDAGIWDDDFVTLYTVETVLTQVLGSQNSPDASLSWSQFQHALAMLITKRAPQNNPERNLNVAMHDGVMPLLMHLLFNCQMLASRLF